MRAALLAAAAGALVVVAAGYLLVRAGELAILEELPERVTRARRRIGRRRSG